MGCLSTIVVASFLLCGAFIADVSCQCPPPNRVYNDKPVCFSDADCLKWGKVCCRNQHNTKSCVDRAPWTSSNKIENDQNYRGVMTGGPGAYCAGVKCMPYEVCKQDPTTKQLRCQRP